MSNSVNLINRKQAHEPQRSSRADRHQRGQMRKRKRDIILFVFLNLLAILAVIGFMMAYRHVANTHSPVDSGVIFGDS
ncbi:hypothetical protein LOC67_09965 [Stieleria sp. JC731]|uniref:hypothetical protein n=1 Tax=Pirellulaceae TaxID=2691357 RepID=UPI001E325D5F|nr:hypothetical protein [Stieleria sp. JC731]MCC9600892.1 hypothetical protein [Stieleria sp. JC731]